MWTILCFGVALFVEISFVNAYQCSTGWSPYGNACYLTSEPSNTLTFTEAEDFCQARGASLVEIESDAEHRFLSSLVLKSHSTHDFWIGLNDKFNEGEWRWFGSNARMSVSFWCPNEPNDANNGEDCALMHRNHGFCWNDDACSTHHNFICEKRAQMDTTTDASLYTGPQQWNTIQFG